MLRKSISVFVAFSVIVFLLSFSVFADDTDQPALMIRYYSNTFSMTTFTTILRSDPIFNYTGNSPSIQGLDPLADIDQFRLYNCGSLDGQFISYQFIICPISSYEYFNGTFYDEVISYPNTGVLPISSQIGCYDVVCTVRPITLGQDITLGTSYDGNNFITYRIKTQSSLFVTLSFVGEKSSMGNGSQIQINLSNKWTPFRCINGRNGTRVPKWVCYDVGNYSSISPAIYSIQRGIGQLYNSVGSIFGILSDLRFSNWSWQAIDRSDPDHPNITDNTGSWWEAVLGSIQAIADPVLQQVEYENKAEDVGAEDALDVAFDSVGSSFGSLGDLAGLGDLGSWDGDIFGANGEQSILDWFSNNTKNSIDAVPQRRRNNLDIIDFYHQKIEDYREEVSGTDDTTAD